MFQNDTNKIELVRGNSAIIDITPINEETREPIRLANGDVVLFTIKTYMGFKKFQKVLTNQDYDSEEDDSLNLILEPEDTINWGIGDYYYDCLLIKADGTANTFISSSIRILKALGVYTDLN